MRLPLLTAAGPSLLAVLVLAKAPSGPWDAFNLAPSSRTVFPRAIHSTSGSVQDASNLVNATGPATLVSNGSFVVLDMVVETGGFVSFNIDSASDGASLALTFTESPLFIDPSQSDSSMTIIPNPIDGALSIPSPLSSGLWDQSTENPGMLRGGFRFLTVSVVSSDQDATVTLSNLSIAITWQPGVQDPSAYSGHFYAPDPGADDADLLTKLWYAGAYTAQTNIISADQGRANFPSTQPGWANNATIGIASPVTVDGSKRDRTIWPGDMGIAVPTEFLSINDLEPTKNSLVEMFTLQGADGALPYCGPTISCGPASVTYHEWTLIGVYNYWLYTNDSAWVESVWSNFTAAVGFLAGRVDPNTGLINSTGMSSDWGRNGGGELSISPNVLYYRVLNLGIELANALGDTSVVDGWSANAVAVKQAVQDHLWNDDLGMFVDNTTSTLTPQDGNSLALLYNLTASDDQKQSISEKLPRNWQVSGAVAPERQDTISPFVGGFEMQAHWEAGQGERALDFIRLQWGYMHTTNISVQSTLIEGYLVGDSLLYYGTDPGYTSHAHGWSTGPTSALIFYVVGLRPITPIGQTWRLAPQPSGLPAAQGSFETALGTFMASWTNDTTAGFQLNLTTPDSTSGVVVLPVEGQTTVDGAVTTVDSGGLQLSGGSHTIQVIV